MRSRLATLRRFARSTAKVAICPAMIYMVKSFMPHEANADIIAIRDWLAKEPHLPQNFDDFMLKKFLHSCYGSLERTKQCINKFATKRSLMPEVYTSRDLDSKALKTVLDMSYVTSRDAGDYEVLIYHLDDPGLEKFVFFDCLKGFAIQADFWLQHINVFPKAHILIMDARNVTLKLIPKINIMYVRDFISYALEAFPIRVKEVHVVNCPPYIETLYNLVKPVVPAEIREIVYFHPGVEELHKVIDKKFLPKDYGGDSPSLRQQQLDRVKLLLEKREMFDDDNMWKANSTIKHKEYTTNNGAVNGSFRTLLID